MEKLNSVEWHGHRGCRGLLPENSIAAFSRAIELGVDALELDVVISKDHQVVIAHEPYMPANICQKPDGSSISPEEEMGINLYALNYSEIAKYNCGLKHPGFPEQEPCDSHRPLLSELFVHADTHCEKLGLAPVGFTIELKCAAEFDGLYHPAPEKYVKLVLDAISTHEIESRCVLQSFDFRILREIRKQAPGISLSMLLAEPFSLADSLQALGFTPEIIGPKFNLLTKDLITDCHAANMRVVPWTINEVSDMKRFISWGVDGIITDYPDRKSQIGE